MKEDLIYNIWLGHSFSAGGASANDSFDRNINVPFTPYKVVVRGCCFHQNGLAVEKKYIQTTMPIPGGVLAVVSDTTGMPDLNITHMLPNWNNGRFTFNAANYLIAESPAYLTVVGGQMTIHLEFHGKN
eukprot:GHVU01175114.1.p1 GENE.GHVU01175114.1~~GHVU01175114.1.p1  ORF type:complete len:129 (-),score=11.80 GHVU01175114.1:162-548(-)